MTLFYNCNILSLDDLTKYPYGVYKIYRINNLMADKIQSDIYK
ncbi:hypothetical protein CLOL250_00827 [Clostridium sp. L2-50]|nr:hypothetical protein CLOL250_00827 [Clostridium sp. L2-50]